MDALCTRIAHIAERIADCERQADRAAGSVQLLLVSKGQTVESIRHARDCGNLAFGESYVQEAIGKMEALKDLSLEWHFIGPLQSNKTRAIAERFSWVHSIDRIKVARRLEQQRLPHLPPLQVCIQVNVSNEASKSGIDCADVLSLARQIAALKKLRLRGLMTVGAPSLSLDEQRRAFARLRTTLNELNANGFLCDTLSMGMSGDFPAAIAEGATLVRIGEAAFGPRN